MPLPMLTLALACAAQAPAPSTAGATVDPAPPTVVEPVVADLPDIAERTVRSVVSIATERAVAQRMSPMELPFFGFGRAQPLPERRQRGLGSGVIVAGDRIVTNHHVVDGADAIQVVLHDGRVLQAELVGSDPRSDLALLSLPDAPEDLEPLTWGDSAGLRLGETVLAVGNPFGMGHSVSRGIVSAKGRGSVGIVDHEDFIQTDAAINPGNSGGALVDLQGRLVGINTAIMSRSGGSQGIGFAIPAHLAERVIADLGDDGVVRRGWLGVAIQPLDEGVADALGIEDRAGVLIGGVADDGAASDAGLAPGDVVRAVDGEPVATVHAFRNRIALAGPGTTVRLRVERDGEPLSIEATLGVHPDDPKGVSAGGSEPVGLDLGVEVEPVEDGLRVREVRAGSAAARAGIGPGDRIVRIDREPATADRLARAGKGTLLWVKRGEMQRFVVIP